ncbi:unnamed protein product [Clonostachys chloroleuca]|uniref:Uncharacterized protein n=1 Tax=Clonostachys chloroleuca TaxID=1926264 RepID=A0AA35VBT9_9HYPO|nr:unnamed protein product [Clonostachys chloroleuca]
MARRVPQLFIVPTEDAFDDLTGDDGGNSTLVLAGGCASLDGQRTSLCSELQASLIERGSNFTAPKTQNVTCAQRSKRARDESKNSRLKCNIGCMNRKSSLVVARLSLHARLRGRMVAVEPEPSNL